MKAVLGNRPAPPRHARGRAQRVLALAGLMVGLLAGCASPPAKPLSAPAPSPSVSAVPDPATAAPAGPMLAAGEQLIGITSEPSGAPVLVNNRLIGRTPLELRVRVTSNGFCADYVTVKARFVMNGPAQASQTVESELTPREKAPAKMNFTPEGVQWRLK